MKIVCPKCESDQLTANQKGFNAGKAIGGAFLTGGIGLLAGFHGSKKVVITCLACGCSFKAGEGKKISVAQFQNVPSENLKDKFSSSSEMLDKKVLNILQNFGRIRAIEFVSKENNISPQEARGYIEDVERRYNPIVANDSRNGGCTATIFVMFAIIILLFILLTEI